ncbi:MAG: tyrosine-type recombinase/integrase [Deltaproteobacteria bacterium]|nr:tyrosine-type recombinase/integrase [Deltaproteobacteria bacterium]
MFVRPWELRHAEWKEINFEESVWRIPAEKMKSRRPHLVTLASQAASSLKELKQFTGESNLLFPGVRVKPARYQTWPLSPL